jgi:hypothetical protein
LGINALCYDGCIGVYPPERLGRAVRWNIKVSKETDLSLRTFLGAQGMKKGDLSKFIEDAVRWRVFHRTVQDIKARNANTGPDELQRIVDEAVREVRAERRAEGRAGKA